MTTKDDQGLGSMDWARRRGEANDATPETKTRKPRKARAHKADKVEPDDVEVETD